MAFCGKCGAKIDDGVKFCPSCGAAVSEKSNTQIKSNVKEDSRLIYEYKGCKGIGLLAIAFGILVVIFTFIYWYIIDFDIGDSNNVGLLGFVILGYGIYCCILGGGLIRCWVKIYNDHLEANTFSALTLNNTYVNIPYHKINLVQISGAYVKIISGSDKIKFLCDNNKKVFEYINERITK